VAGLGAARVAGAGLALAVLGSLVSSTGNLLSQRLYARGFAVVPSTAWGMAYGAAAIAISCALRGVPFRVDLSLPYLASIAYLSVFGSVAAFIMYLSLIRRVGAGPAGYSAAVIPVLAMLVSTAFEGYRWTAPAALGVALVVLGNVLVLSRRGVRPPVD
jgi:drug/metabolite transporter (DMT)-like permease